jgi:hypothetical protein
MKLDVKAPREKDQNKEWVDKEKRNREGNVLNT